MTIPLERTRSLIETKEFLESLTYPPSTPRVPAAVRDTARQLLRHYPAPLDLQCANRALPDIFGPVPAVIFPAKDKAKQQRGLAKMVEASERLGLYDQELEGVPVRAVAKKVAPVQLPNATTRAAIKTAKSGQVTDTSLDDPSAPKPSCAGNYPQS